LVGASHDGEQVSAPTPAPRAPSAWRVDEVKAIDDFDDDPAEEPDAGHVASGARRPPPAAHRASEGGTSFAARVLPAGVRGALWRLDARGAVVLVVVAVLAFGSAFVAFARAPRSAPLEAPTSLPTLTGSASTVPSDRVVPSTAATIIVDVAGLVARPGVVTLPTGSRVIDALRAAGGARAGVDLSSLNLARVLVDGEQVAVGVPPAPGPPDPGGAPGPLDLNTASAEDLDGLPGIGPVLADRIVAWRDEHGRFSSVDELLVVPGIGPSILTNIGSLVRV
jgi:competence protein ComEA